MPFLEKSSCINLVCMMVALAFLVASYRDVTMFFEAVAALVGLHFGHFGGHADGLFFRIHTMAYIAVVAVIFAELVRAASQIVYFRLGR